jgi:hypothetical protein
MQQRKKQVDEPRRPEPPWLAGAMIGLTVATLATGAIMLGASMALGQAVTRGK